MSRRSTSVTRTTSRSRSAQETVIMLSLFGSLLLVACLFMISYLKEEADEQTVQVTDVQTYSLTVIAIVAIAASIHYFGHNESGMMRLLVLGLSVAGLVLSCLGIRYALRLAEDDTVTYTDEYKAMRWLGLSGFTSSLLFSAVMTVKYLSTYGLVF